MSCVLGMEIIPADPLTWPSAKPIATRQGAWRDRHSVGRDPGVWNSRVGAIRSRKVFRSVAEMGLHTGCGEPDSAIGLRCSGRNEFDPTELFSPLRSSGVVAMHCGWISGIARPAEEPIGVGAGVLLHSRLRRIELAVLGVNALVGKLWEE